jgi:hypothetical protein
MHEVIHVVKAVELALALEKVLERNAAQAQQASRLLLREGTGLKAFNRNRFERDVCGICLFREIVGEFNRQRHAYTLHPVAPGYVREGGGKDEKASSIMLGLV